MTRAEFEELVSETLDALPEEFAAKLDNVTVTVAAWPTAEQLRLAGVRPGMTLFGLYQGVPHPKRTHYTGVLPDTITLFAGPILGSTDGSRVQVKTEIGNTLLHEIGHHFGMNEEEIRKAQRVV